MPQTEEQQIAAGWYRFGHSSKIKKGKVYTFNYFGTAFVGFRNAEGTLSVFNAFCPHLGAHLGVGGKIEKDKLICPFHGWQYNSQGACVHIPYCQTIPKKAQLERYPVKEIHSFIYVFFSQIPEIFTDTAIQKNDALAFLEQIPFKDLLTLQMKTTVFQRLLALTKSTLTIQVHAPGFFIAKTKKERGTYLITVTPISNSLLSVSIAVFFKRDINPLRIFSLQKKIQKEFRLLLHAAEGL